MIPERSCRGKRPNFNKNLYSLRLVKSHKFRATTGEHFQRLWPTSFTLQLGQGTRGTPVQQPRIQVSMSLARELPLACESKHTKFPHLPLPSTIEILGKRVQGCTKQQL